MTIAKLVRASSPIGRPRKAHHTSDAPLHIRRAMAAFVVANGNFNRFITVTFRLPVSGKVARDLVGRFLSVVAATLVRDHFLCFIAAGGEAFGHYHFHMLAELPASVGDEEVVRAWGRLHPTTGRCTSATARSARAVAQYLEKHEDRGVPFVVCPRTARGCRRRKGCVAQRAFVASRSPPAPGLGSTNPPLR